MEFYKETEFKDTEIGKIPEDWEVVKLEKICRKIKAGGTPSTKKPEYWNGNIPFVKIEDITSAGKYLKKTSNHISEEGLKRSNAWIVPENSLLLAMYGSLGEIAINKIPVATNQAILGIITNESICDVEFLYYWFLYFKPNWKRYAKPTTQANLTAEIVKNTLIPLPPLEEQKKIAEILSTIDKAIEKTDEIIAKTERLKKGLMQELLSGRIRVKVEDGRIGFYKETQFKDTEIGKVPKEWRVIKIKDIGLVFTGKTPPTSNEKYWSSKDYPFVTPGDIGELPYVYTTERYVSKEGARYIGKILPKNTVLVVCIGSSIGKVALTYSECVTNQQINAIIPDKNKVDSRYLYYELALRSSIIKSWSGQAALPIIKKSLFEQFKIPLPPLEEQKQIARILSSFDKKIEIEKKQKEKLERIKKGLMDVLLTGKVRVKV